MAQPMDAAEVAHPETFSVAEVGALAHLYRGEVYRSTMWRTRLDNTTNWAVVTLGIALSVSFSSKDASALPLLLVGLLIMIFLILEARRYRYFNVWRARCRWMETHLYAPILRRTPVEANAQWTEMLAEDYCHPQHHISFVTAIGRRLRRNYCWILAIQTLAYFGKVLVHPAPITSLAEFWERTAIGPIPGHLVVAAGFLYNAAWIGFALYTLSEDSRKHGQRGYKVAMG